MSCSPKIRLWKTVTEMNRETNTPRCRIYHGGTAWAVHGIYKQNERCIVLIPLLKFGDFVTWDKARNAFLTQGFLPSGFAKLEQTERNIKYIWIFLRCRLIKRCAQHRLKIVCLILDCKTSYFLREHCICNRVAPLAARRQGQSERSSEYLFFTISIAMTLQYVQRSGDESIATPITATAT